MAQKVSKMPGNRGIPGKHTLEIVAFQEGDPAYQIALPNGGTAPGGVSVATLQERFGDQTGTVKGPEGDTYEISLTPWANQDTQKTLLQMTYRFTPLFPVKADPALGPSPFLAPKPSAQEASPARTPAPHLQAHPSSTSFRPRSFFMGRHFASGHSVKITPTTDESGITVQDLLARPEISQDEIACPLCGTKIPVHANIEEYIKQALQHSPVEISRVYVNIAHPSNTPESQTPPADYPFHIDRIWRYDPISEPPAPPAEETELSVGVKSHDHIITIKPATRGTSAALLLSLPQTQQQEITCPFCDIPLHTAKPLAESIRAFAQQAGSEQAFIAWSVAHPDDIPATKTPPADIPLLAVTYNRTTDNLLEQGLTEGNPTFVLKPKPQDSNG